MLEELIKQFGPETAILLIAIVALWRMIIYFNKREEKVQDRVLTAFEKNTEVLAQVHSSLEKSADATKENAKKIEDIWIRAIKNNGND